MKATVQVLAQGVRKSFKDGAFIQHECQCVVLGDAVEVGVLKVSDRVADPILVQAQVPVVDLRGNPVLDDAGKQKIETVRVVPAGAYELEYGLGISWDKKELGGVLKSIVRVGAGNKVLASLEHAATPANAAEAKA